jgi:hypothetical protein
MGYLFISDFITEAQDFVMLFVCHPNCSIGENTWPDCEQRALSDDGYGRAVQGRRGLGRSGGQELREAAFILSLCSAMRGGIFKPYHITASIGPLLSVPLIS